MNDKPFLPGFEYDVFVSYAHADNQKPEGAQAKYGWVTTLAHNLNVGPNMAKKRIFIDHQLKPADLFNDDLRDKVVHSATLLILLSQNYIDSGWCGTELEHFITTHTDDPTKPRNVFVVELAPFESFENVGDSIKNLRKELIHAKFWDYPLDSPSPMLAGYPSPVESGMAQHYWRSIIVLTSAIDTRLRQLRAHHEPEVTQLGARLVPVVSTGVTTIPPILPGEPRSAILLADVTDDLETKRLEVKIYLEKEGIRVLPEGDYVGLPCREFEQAFASDLKESRLFVQLLSTTAGRKGKGFPMPLPQLQFEYAQAARVPILQWCEVLPQAGAITDSGHEALFNTPFIHVTNLVSFEGLVLEELKKLSAPTKAWKTGKRIVFIDDALIDETLSERIRAIIKRESWEIRNLPLDIPLQANGSESPAAAALRVCQGGLTVFADRRDKPTVYSRLFHFLNQIAEKNLPLSHWGVYFGPPPDKGSLRSEFGIDSEDVVAIAGTEGVNEDALVAFLRSLSR